MGLKVMKKLPICKNSKKIKKRDRQRWVVNCIRNYCWHELAKKSTEIWKFYICSVDNPFLNLQLSNEVEPYEVQYSQKLEEKFSKPISHAPNPHHQGRHLYQMHKHRCNWLSCPLQKQLLLHTFQTLHEFSGYQGLWYQLQMCLHLQTVKNAFHHFLTRCVQGMWGVLQ